MKILGVIVLAVIQGIAEFLPISSSAHLIIFRDLFGVANWMSSNSDLCIAFDLALHLGTLLAILVYFFKSWVVIFKDGFTKPKSDSGKLLWYLVIATIPAGIAGVLLDDVVEGYFRTNYLLIALALAVIGVIIYYFDKTSKQTKDLNDMSLKDAIIIGCSQILALIPGFSRSGTTIATARKLGFNRSDAARFSFYLSAPVVLGAVALKLIKKGTWLLISTYSLYFIIGLVVAFLVGIVCIKYLLKYLKQNDFKIFMWYRLALAIIVVVITLLK